MKSYKSSKRKNNYFIPNAKFLEYGIIFISVGSLGLIHGGFSSWWGSGLSQLSAMILVAFLLCIGISSLLLFIIWFIRSRPDRENVKGIISIIAAWFILVLLYLLENREVFQLPVALHVILVIGFIIYMDHILTKINFRNSNSGLN